MICAQWDSSGVVSVVSVPPTDLSTCALLLPSGAEGVSNPLALSSADGGAIAAAVVFVWAVGFAGRALIRALS